MREPLAWIDDELRHWEDLGLRRTLVERQCPQSAEITLGGQTLLNFGSNDYLGLAGELLNASALQAIPQVGWGSGASPLITGRGEIHALLEREIAEFEGTEAALLFSSGFAANCGTIPALAQKGDVIFSDAKNHASIIDGCRLSGARVVVFPHRDLTYLDMMLRQSTAFRRRLIVTDGLFSMDGDLAPLPELVDLAERYDAMVYVDEAHATGVLGEHGRGSSEHWGVEDRVPIRMGTLSKALGSAGGFVAGSRPLIEWLVNRARTYVFSTAWPEAVAAAGRQALQIVRSEPYRRQRLLERAAQVRQALRAQGWNVGDSSSQIIPVVIGAAEKTMQMATELRSLGLFIPGIRPPTVPAGESLLRISLTYAHTETMLARLADGFAQLARGGRGADGGASH